jgi:SAM-dependent methyltransferase
VGDVNQRIFLERLVPGIDGPVVEVGSKDYGSTTSFRDLYRGREYVGVDLETGKGVDVVADLSAGTGRLPVSHFALGICCSVLEHTPRPWVMAENIVKLLRPGGQLYISVPWVWRYTPIRRLLPLFAARGGRTLPQRAVGPRDVLNDSQRRAHRTRPPGLP